nr:cerebellin-2-like [Labrus bergylta]
MTFANVCISLLLCGLISAQDYRHSDHINETIEAYSYCPDMCDLLGKFGAMTEKFRDMQTRLMNTESRLMDSENEILKLRNKERTKAIFSAATGGGDRAIGPYNTDVTLIYRKVIANIGNAYNAATGIFTAPVPGVYYFTFFCHAGGRYEVKLFLFKNGEKIVGIHDHSSYWDTADNGGNAVFLQLQQRDQVYVSMPANSHVWGDDYVTTFSGSLVTQM